MATKLSALQAPFPAFGGKSRIAKVTWERLGDVNNYVEPFCFSAAMLLARPTPGRAETLNDANHYVANFWRALKYDPDGVTDHADWPVNKTDLTARHRWLVLSRESAEWHERMTSDPDYYDAKIAGWWAWGASAWIGSGWCDDNGRKVNGDRHESRPQLGTFGVGVHRKVPGRESRGHDGLCAARREWLGKWLGSLADRLREVRVSYGDWSSVCNSRSTTTAFGITGVFLDPPYPIHADDGSQSRAGSLYGTDAAGTEALDRLRDDVLAWCREWGPNPLMRIAVCGYDTDGYAALESDGWSRVAWKAEGGMANTGDGMGKANAHRERVWFSPACVDVGRKRYPLFLEDR